MTNVLIDSSIIIEFLRVQEKSETILIKLAASQEYTIHVSMITYTEIFAGKSVWEKEEVRAMVDDLFLGMTILPIDTDIAEHAGAIRAKLGTGLADSVIAATALAKGMSVATLDYKDFQPIEDLKIFDVDSLPSLKQAA